MIKVGEKKKPEEKDDKKSTPKEAPKAKGSSEKKESKDAPASKKESKPDAATPPMDGAPAVPSALMEAPELPTDAGGLVDPAAVRYMTADMGPFQCDHCIHWQDGGTCNVVAGPIDPMGVCILFEAAEMGGAPEIPGDVPPLPPLPEEEPEEAAELMA